MPLNFRARVLINRGSTAEYLKLAEAFLEPALQLDPNNVDALAAKGWVDMFIRSSTSIRSLPKSFVRRGAIPGGLTWHFARPPVQGLDFEVDVRGVAHELVI